MEKIRRFLKRIRFVYRKSTPLTKAVVLSAIILSMAALLTIQLSLNATNDRIGALKDQAAELEHENQVLTDNIDDQGSIDGVIGFAQDILGLIFPDITIVEPEE